MEKHIVCSNPPSSLSYLFFLLALSISHHFRVAIAQNTSPKTVHVGVVLDLDSMAGKRSKTSITMALEDFYKIRDNFSTRIQLEYRDSKSDVVLAASSAVSLFKSHIEVILGPLTSTETKFVAYLCNRSHVPLISFTATSPAISHSQLPFFVRASLNDSSQLTPIAAFIQYFGWRAAVPIYEDTDYGADIMPFLVDALQSVDTKIPDRVVISTKASDVHIDDELYRLMKQQTRVFVVHMSQELASRFFLRAQAVGMMFEGYVWIVTDSIGDLIDTFEPKVISAMEGVIGFKSHVHMSKKLKSFYIRFKERFRQDHPGTEIVDPSIYQLWAYDAVWALATAVEKVKLTYPSFLVPPSAETSDLSSIGVSQNGPKLLNEILGITFGGLAGNFRIVDGQLQLLAFEIFNVIGKGARRIGFWTPDKGIVREIDPQKANSNANRLRTITWPGDTSELPKGWAVPAYKKPLKIGVPEKNGFSVFVNVSGTTQESVSPSNVTGYCIDVFREVLRNLPYDVSFEFVPYKLGSYNEMVQKVSSKEFDAVVGDVTIRANRTNYGDFTMPYTESGVSMVVPVQKASSQSMWIFVKPFTATLWLMSLTFFIFTGFVVWVIEHRINPEFRGTAWQQFGITYYFAFSTLVFAHKEKLQSNLSKFMVIIWVFVVLILTSSYTASLTSMLTVQQLRPSVTDVNQLLKQGEYVGYQNGSFVDELLLKLGFDAGKLKNLSSADDYADALAKGSANGGVAAIFDEIPYLKVFLSQYCGNNYVMIGPTYKTEGFGFVFPRGSPLLQDMSRAVLSVTEGDNITEIERKWFGDTNCTSSSASVSSSSLDFHSFAGLFIITGGISGLMLLIHIGIILYKERKSSPWEILHAFFQSSDTIDQNSPTFQGYVRSSTSWQERSPEGTVRQTGLAESLGLSSPDNISSQQNDWSLNLPETDSANRRNRGSNEEIELTGSTAET